MFARCTVMKVFDYQPCWNIFLGTYILWFLDACHSFPDSTLILLASPITGERGTQPQNGKRSIHTFCMPNNQVVVFSPLLASVSNTILLRSLFVTNEVQALISVPDSELVLQVPAILQEQGGGTGKLSYDRMGTGDGKIMLILTSKISDISIDCI